MINRDMTRKQEVQKDGMVKTDGCRRKQDKTVKRDETLGKGMRQQDRT